MLIRVGAAIGLSFFLTVVAVVYALPLYTIVLIPDPPGGGVVIGGGSYPKGAVVRVEALPSPGYYFVNWTEEGAEVSSSPVYEFPAVADRTLVAHFAPIEYPAVVGLNSSGKLHILPAVGLEMSRLNLMLTFGQEPDTWQLIFGLLFRDAGFAGLSVSSRGNIGDVRIGAGLSFDPLVPIYRAAYFCANIRGEQLSFTGRVQHFGGGPLQPSRMCYIGNLAGNSFSVIAKFEDNDTGIAFKEVMVRAKYVIWDESTLLLTNSGFQYVEFKTQQCLLFNIPFDVSARFTVEETRLTLTPRWSSVGKGCVTAYGNVVWADNAVAGLELYGLKLRYDLSERCPKARVSSPYVEFVTAWEPRKLAWAGFRNNEFEYLKLGFCGPGCCELGYSVELAMYFGESETLFGISRVLVKAFVPIMDVVTLAVEFGVDAASGGTTLDVGWELCG